MNIKLRKFSIIKPIVKINTGIKTIARESHGGNNVPVYAIISARTIGQPIVGNLEELGE